MALHRPCASAPHQHRPLLAAIYLQRQPHHLLPGRAWQTNLDTASLDNYDAPIPHAASGPKLLRPGVHLEGSLALADVITLTRTVAALEIRHKNFRVVPPRRPRSRNSAKAPSSSSAHHVFELANIARPGILQKAIESSAAQ